MEEATGGKCTSCDAEFPSLNEDKKCEGCAGGGENPGKEAPAAEAPAPAEAAPAADAPAEETPAAE